jgi:hypothetical protein
MSDRDARRFECIANRRHLLITTRRGASRGTRGTLRRVICPILRANDRKPAPRA